MFFFSNSKLSFISLNARGLRDPIKRTFLFCKNEKACVQQACALLQETHSNAMDGKFWSNQWGDRIVFSHGQQNGRGSHTLLNNFPGKILTTNRDPFGH